MEFLCDRMRFCIGFCLVVKLVRLTPKRALGVGAVAKKRYQAVGFLCNRMLKLSSSRGIRIDVPVMSVSWSVEDHSVIIQALRKDLSSARPVILESLAGSPLVQIVWQRLQVARLSPYHY